jgi:hypothetical protein
MIEAQRVRPLPLSLKSLVLRPKKNYRKGLRLAHWMRRCQRWG